MRLLLALIMIGVLAVAGPAAAGNHKNKGKGKGNSQTQSHSGGGKKKDSSDYVVDAVVGGLITALELSLIQDYFGSRVLPPSLANPQALPPGIRKNLARGKPMPPGIAKKFLPADLRGQLPYRAGEEWRVVGHDVLLVAAATNVIVDVIKDVF